MLQDARQWLKQAQGYILHLQAAMNSLVACAAEPPAWSLLYRDAADALGRVVEGVISGGSSVSKLYSHCWGRLSAHGLAAHGCTQAC